MPEEKPIQNPTIVGLPDPYSDMDTKPNFRLNVEVVTDDILVIQSVAPSRGTKQHLIAAYVKSLADELRARGITSYSPENITAFREIVERRNTWSLGHTNTRTPGQAGAGNDTGGKVGVRKGNKNTTK